MTNKKFCDFDQQAVQPSRVLHHLQLENHVQVNDAPLRGCPHSHQVPGNIRLRWKWMTGSLQYGNNETVRF